MIEISYPEFDEEELGYKMEDVVQLNFMMPEGLTAEELAIALKAEIKGIVDSGVTFGKIVRLYGRMTIGMAAVLGHELAHVSKAVLMFDPKEDSFYMVVWH